MLEVFRKSGFEPHISWDEGVMRVELPATPSEKALAQAEAREKIATVASLDPFFRPQSIAVVGIDQHANGLVRRVFEQLIRSGFHGPVYPVHPSARSIAAVRAFPSVTEIPDEIEMAILAVPAKQVLAELDACAAAHVRVVLVLSAGFEETDAEGVQRHNTLLSKVRAHGMRMVGPNCIGLLNTAPDISLNATVLPDPVQPGRIAVLTQSGALGATALDYLQVADLGISMFVNVGDKADVSSNDLLQRKHAVADLAALEDLLLRVSWLIKECPEISALELQSVSVRTADRGVAVRGGRVSVRPLRLGAGLALS